MQLLETEKRFKPHKKKKKKKNPLLSSRAKTHTHTHTHICIYHPTSMHAGYKCFVHKTSTLQKISLFVTVKVHHKSTKSHHKFVLPTAKIHWRPLTKASSIILYCQQGRH